MTPSPYCSFQYKVFVRQSDMIRIKILEGFLLYQKPYNIDTIKKIFNKDSNRSVFRRNKN